MVDHKQAYQSEAKQYDQLVSFEDYEHNLLPAIRKAGFMEGMAVLELGAGTGRLTTLLQPLVKKIMALDLSHSMLKVANKRLLKSYGNSWLTAAADHRQLPVKDHCADTVIAGWSICYLADWFPATWQVELDKAFKEMDRVLIKHGRIILIETQGTGFESPHPPEHLYNYFEYLNRSGFESFWIRTDYQFPELETAVKISGFFFGDEMAKKVEQNKWLILPECTGIWVKTV